jgi:hypothetical protein
MTHLLALAGARANLVFHDLIDGGGSTYAVPSDRPLQIAAEVRRSGISGRVRFYFDDGRTSAKDACRALRGEHPEIELIVAVTITTVGHADYLSYRDLREMREWGVRIAGHGYQHVRLASYGEHGVLPTAPDGPYQAAAGADPQAPLSANEVLFQLTETRDHLHGLGSDEFVLPYGAYNRQTIFINERHRLYGVLASADYGWDLGGTLRPRLLVDAQLDPSEIPTRLASPWPSAAPT